LFACPSHLPLPDPSKAKRIAQINKSESKSTNPESDSSMGVRKRLDDRVRRLLEIGLQTRHRSMLVVVGDHGRDQVVNLHQILIRQ
jgi:hypothetical protein